MRGHIRHGWTDSRLEPIHEAHNVRMLEILEHVQLIVYHALVALDILLEDDLDGHLPRRPFGLSHDTIGPRAERATESVFRPTRQQSGARRVLSRGLHCRTSYRSYQAGHGAG